MLNAPDDTSEPEAMGADELARQIYLTFKFRPSATGIEAATMYGEAWNAVMQAIQNGTCHEGKVYIDKNALEGAKLRMIAAAAKIKKLVRFGEVCAMALVGDDYEQPPD